MASEAGYLVFFKKNGEKSDPYELDQREITIGSSFDSDIRLKMKDNLLQELHAVIEVNENGIASIVNKSKEAPIKINDKATLEPVILRHQDKFDVLGKVFQYFNENLADEMLNRETIIKEQKNIAAKSRKSVMPLIRTPIKKTKTPIRKSLSTTKPIRSADNLEHNIVKNKEKTPRKSLKNNEIKHEKNLSVSLIDLGTPDGPNTNSVSKTRETSVRKSTVTIKPENFIEETVTRLEITLGSSNLSTTPINKRIQALKTTRHSVKKDTPPPKLNISKIVVQPNTPQEKKFLRKVTELSPKGSGNISVTFSPNAEVSSSSSVLFRVGTMQDEKTPRRSIMKKTEDKEGLANRSRVSFAIEAPNEEFFETSGSIDEEQDLQEDKNVSMRLSSEKIGESDEEIDDPTEAKARRSSRYSLNSTKKLDDLHTEIKTEKNDGTPNKRLFSRRSSQGNIESPRKGSRETIHPLQSPTSEEVKGSRSSRYSVSSIQNLNDSVEKEIGKGHTEMTPSKNVFSRRSTLKKSYDTIDDVEEKLVRASQGTMNSSRQSTILPELSENKSVLLSRRSTLKRRDDSIEDIEEKSASMERRSSRYSLNSAKKLDASSHEEINEKRNKSTPIARVSIYLNESDETIDDVEENSPEKSFKVSNVSRRSARQSLRLTETSEDDVEENYNLLGVENKSLRQIVISVSTEDSANEEIIEEKANTSRRSGRFSAKLQKSSTEDSEDSNKDTLAESSLSEETEMSLCEDTQLSSLSGTSRNSSKRSTEKSPEKSYVSRSSARQTDASELDAKENHDLGVRNRSSRGILVSVSTEDLANEEIEDKPNVNRRSGRSSAKLHKSLSQEDSNIETLSEISTSEEIEKSSSYEDIRSSRVSRNLSKRSTKFETSQPSIDSEEGTFKVLHETQEVEANTSKNKSKQIISIFDETTQEVLSPVKPLSERSKSTQNEEPEKYSASTRKSLTRRSVKSIGNDSSLTSTSVHQSSSLVTSVSSQSFSSFKRNSQKEELQSNTDPDVGSASSTFSTPAVKKGMEENEDKNVFGSSKRQSRESTRASQMFEDVSCTSTPFNKQRLSKKSQDLESSIDEDATINVTSVSSTAISRRSSRQLEIFSVSSDSVFTDSPKENSFKSRSSDRQNSKTLGRTGNQSSIASKRRSSLRLSISSRGGEDNCISCRSSAKRSRSLSLNVEEGASKRSSSLTNSVELEDETPKSSIKPRRSSKSVYNPVTEDDTPVTPERLPAPVREEAFKTPINTPGLFESIRKSAIRSRKRGRESTGSAMKSSKKPRVDFTDERDDKRVRRRQKSPKNDLTNVKGVKKLLKTPQKSPKNDLRNIPNLKRIMSPKVQHSPKNDYTNVAGVKKMFNTPKELKSPKNDLRKVPNLRNLMSPKRQNSPKNDLTQIPNLRRVMSPRNQNSPKNDLSDPVGVKKLLLTPKVQREPLNDLSDVEGVANIFNVSGVDVLTHGSDIENSEDLFTKLTGKRPMRAYPKGKSLSPKKDNEPSKKSRKTMGDLPDCSPRVQQWVEEQVAMVHSPTKHEDMQDSDEEDVFFNMSTNARRKSRAGRSISPKKTKLEAQTRRKTLGDGFQASPNVSSWKLEQKAKAEARVDVKRELLSPTPSTVFPNDVKAELFSPKPSTPVMNVQLENLTPSSVKTRGRPRKAVMGNDSVDQSTMAVEVENKVLENVRRGGRTRRILSTDELNTVPSTSSTPVQEASGRSVRGRRGNVKAEETPQEDEDVRKTSAKEILAEKAEETDVPKTRGKKRLEVEQIVEEQDTKSSVKKGGRSKKSAFEDLANEVEEGTSKEPPMKRSRRNKVPEEIGVKDIPTQSPVKKPTRGRPKKPIKSEEKLEAVEDKDEVSPTKKPSTRKPRNKAVEDAFEDEPTEASVQKPTKGRPKKQLKTEEKLEVAEDKNETSPMKRPSTRKLKNKVTENVALEDKPTESSVKRPGRGRPTRQPKKEHSEDEASLEKKPNIRNPRNKVTEDVALEEKPTEPSVEKAARGKPTADKDEASPMKKPNTRKLRKQIADVSVEDKPTESLVQKPTRGRAKRQPKAEENSEDKEEASPIKKPQTRNKGFVVEDTPTESPVRKPTKGRSKKQPKAEEKLDVAEDKDEASPIKKPSTRKLRNKVTEDDKPTESHVQNPKKGRAKQQPKSEEDEASSVQKPNTRTLRNKIVEDVIAAEVDSPRTLRAKRGVNKKYSTDEYEVVDKKGSKKMVRFETETDDAQSHGDTLELKTKRSKKK